MKGQAAVWLILTAGVVIFLACLLATVAFVSSNRAAAVVSCVQAGGAPETCSKALRP